MKTTSASTVTMPPTVVLVADSAVFSIAANESPTAERLTVMPTRPVSSSGLRPNLSTQATAMSVASTFTTPTAQSVAFACCSAVVKPASAKISFA